MRTKDIVVKVPVVDGRGILEVTEGGQGDVYLDGVLLEGVTLKRFESGDNGMYIRSAIAELVLSPLKCFWTEGPFPTTVKKG